ARALSLAIDCTEETLTIDPAVKDQLNRFLEQGREDPDQALRLVIAEALLRRRLDQMIHLHDKVFIDTSFVTYVEYQPFLDEQQARGKSYQPLHWQTPTFPQGEGHLAVLGVQPSDALAFCEWLTEKDSICRYRLPTKAEQ